MTQSVKDVLGLLALLAGVALGVFLITTAFTLPIALVVRWVVS